MGRPTKCTPDVIKTIADGIRLGMHYHHAAQRAGVTYESFRLWQRKGEKGESPYSAFAAAIKEAEAHGAAQCLAVIHRAAQEDRQWTAAAWLLERRHPQLYGRKVVEQQDGGRAPIDTDLRAMSDAELDEAILEMAEDIKAASKKQKKRKKVKA